MKTPMSWSWLRCAGRPAKKAGSRSSATDRPSLIRIVRLVVLLIAIVEVLMGGPFAGMACVQNKGALSASAMMAISSKPMDVAAASIAEWPVTGGDAGGTRYSPLADIHRNNVRNLQVAWTYRHGDYRSGWPDPFKGTAFQCTPIVVERRLVFTTPYNRVIALDP